MLLQFRSDLFFYYRLLFITLFFMLGISGTGIVILEHYAGIETFIAESEFDKDALYTTSKVVGALGFIVTFIMLFLMRERRDLNFDRRKSSIPLDFSDRRNNDDRRSR